MGNDGCIRSYLVTILFLGVFGLLGTLGSIGIILAVILSWILVIFSMAGGSSRSIDYGVSDDDI